MPITQTRNTITVLAQGGKEDNGFARDVQKGLSAAPKRIPSMYFYDEKGSNLFREIMKLEEYYPTGCEREIFETYKGDMLQLIGGTAFQLVDLGAGDAEKTRILLDHFSTAKSLLSYVPIDISGHILQELVSQLEKQMPGLNTQGLVAEYFQALQWLSQDKSTRKFVFFMGGNIGNFTKEEAAGFLRKMNEALNEGDLLLLGFDLKKDPRTILRAYDDTRGVTAEFNYNLLARINRELGADFNISLWKHYASYEPISGMVQSYLISQCEQEVYISALNQSFHFDVHEPIHTEYSIKYSLAEVEELARQSGFEIIKHFSCKRNYFLDTVWRVAK